MKTKLFAAGLMLMSTVALAQVADPVTEQIRITQDNVRLAQEQVENGLGYQPNDSADADVRMTAFNNAAKIALREFESAIKLRILTPMQALVSQYNQTYRATGMDESVRNQVMTGLYPQIERLAGQLQDSYYNEVIKLYRPMGVFPVGVRVDSNENVCMSTNPYAKLVTYSQSEVRIRVNSGCSTYDSYYRNYSKSRVENVINSLEPKLSKLFLRGCYSVNCYYISYSAALRWTAMVENLLTRELKIRLANGTEVRINPVAKSAGEKIVLAPTTFLTQVKPPDELNSYPTAITLAELKPLADAEAARIAREDQAEAAEYRRQDQDTANALTLASAQQKLKAAWEQDPFRYYECVATAKEVKNSLIRAGLSSNMGQYWYEILRNRGVTNYKNIRKYYKEQAKCMEETGLKPSNFFTEY